MQYLFNTCTTVDICEDRVCKFDIGRKTYKYVILRNNVVISVTKTKPDLCTVAQ
jgi:hypothetical protein